MERASDDDVLIAHSSDLHIDDDLSGRAYGPDGTAGLRAVLAASREAGAHVLLLAGDTFDNNRVGVDTLARVAAFLADAGLPIVLLPGNHDPAFEGSIYHRGGLARVPNLHVLGLTHADTVMFPELQLEISGIAHRDYEDMAPLRPGPPRDALWHVVMAHGHFEWRRDRANPLRPSWLFSEDEISATRADYLALGHWDRAAAVGTGDVPAYYSGSPDLARTINLVRLSRSSGVSVSRRPLAPFL